MVGFLKYVPQRKEIVCLYLQHLAQLVSWLDNLRSIWVVMLLEVQGVIIRYFPEGIDIYFENVGGKMLDIVLLNMKFEGRIAICGMVSQYNNVDNFEGVKNLMHLVFKAIRMEGLQVYQYYHLYPNMLEFMLPLVRQKKINYVEEIVEGLENAPTSLVGLFDGNNYGKQVIQVAH